MPNLYELATVDSNGERTVIYGHATENVMSQFWEAYAERGLTVEIRLAPNQDNDEER